ncbi:hypothetical protein [Petrocella sp. FN5]|uniref:hypothetical protein n=1 Tax=Petrocella sp. FN5 TaxID=3032002 RepID=UPI0023DA3CC6|nr:hypothetical protein [Petrocella sp. FN5]MDF1618718.1 hypothetical protein [Petrocella sp. FN5]
MELSPEVIGLSTQLATVAGRKTVETIFDKIRTVKEKGNKDEIINSLEEIINDLISDKNELIQISKTYEEKLITQKMSDKEIDYITTSILPLVELLVMNSGNSKAQEMQASLALIKPILSKETISIMQILGFNFRRALGEPLTELIASLICSKMPASSEKKDEIQLNTIQREIEHMKLCQDEDAYNRLMKLYGRSQ